MNLSRRLHGARALRGRGDVFGLPAMEITGNSHVPMMDDNAAEPAAIAADRLDARSP